MKSKTKYLMVALAAILALIMARPCAAAVTANSPSLTYNSTTYTTGAADAVNASGQVAGTVTDASGTMHACVWTDGTPTVLPNASVTETYGGTYDYDVVAVYAMNDSGAVVGYSQSQSSDSPFLPAHATLWTPNSDGSYTATDLGVPSDQYGDSTAFVIDNQGQILCSCGNTDTLTNDWYLWDSGTWTLITTSDGTAIDAWSQSFGMGALMSANGWVAGTANGQAVLWKDSSGTISHVTLTTDGGYVDAISPGGVVVGYDDGLLKYFVYQSGNFNYVDPSTFPTDNYGTPYTPMGIQSVNDQGQALFLFATAFDSQGEPTNIVPWIWQANTGWTQVTLPTGFSVPSGDMLWTLGVINNAGQVAADAVDYTSMTSTAFGWSATGAELLSLPAGVSSTDMTSAIGLNDSGLAVGGVGASLYGITSGDALPVTWNLPTPPTPQSALDISTATATSPNPHSPIVTVTVTITNPSSTDTAYNVTVTAASLGDVDTNSVLPLVYGAIKPGESKECTLQFKKVPSGDQTLTITGTSSLGAISSTQTVNVP